MSILIYEDSGVAKLTPITTARPAFCVTAGSFNLLDLLSAVNVPLFGSVRSYLRELCELDHPNIKLVSGSMPVESLGPTVALNARVEPSIETLKTVQAILAGDVSQTGIIWHDDEIAAVIRPGWEWKKIIEARSFDELLEEAKREPSLPYELRVMSFPHDVVAANMSTINASLEYRIANGKYSQTADGVFVAEGAEIGEFVLTETHDGPIIIESGASIGPYTLLRGPIYVGPNSRILEHAAIKDAVSLGHTTKIGGEVEAAVVEPYSNKQHHGFLGHSYLGSWINLGAGTCNSDLKNTYGTVNMEYPAGKVATGMQFLGCVMGDYSKTAINTGLFTGKVVGTCSMMYGFVTSNVPSFVNYARLFGQMSTLPPEIMIATQHRMFSRRKVEQRPCDMQLLHDM